MNSQHVTLLVLLDHKAMSHEAIFSWNLQLRSKLPFTRETAPCNTSSLQNNSTAGHTTTCICLQFYRSLQCLFHLNLRCKLQEKIASRDSTLSSAKKTRTTYATVKMLMKWTGFLKYVLLWCVIIVGHKSVCKTKTYDI